MISVIDTCRISSNSLQAVGSSGEKGRNHRLDSEESSRLNPLEDELLIIEPIQQHT